ncbi:hypothetical protein HMPREF0995_02593 [Lachnospiraceae bacterium 7_1_58FAA]|jgi:hypothetical protein|uniref:S-layer homology domain-containing protein n=1 Tax=Flavonifractor plautii TaxID=292800 RepID=UPI000246C580|nr:S-layer homology domain-containing protein [Flavonifractor plautii]EHO33458.1 hypothetical protein HMPREF0995_02593 [Lachnospiraceae bacterium 7_1_58FAA]
MRRFLTGLLCLSMLSSLSVPAFASDNMQGSTGVTITVEGQGDSGGGSSGGGDTNGGGGGSTETGKGEQSGGSDGKGNDYFLNEGISVEEDVKLYGYMIGMPGYVFGKDYNLTRAEYATIIDRVFVFEGEEEITKSFLDIKGHWAEAQISRLASQGVVYGVSATHFKPDDPITRDQVLLMLSRILYTANFSTDNKVVDLSDHYAKKQIAQMLNSGIVPTYDSSYDLSQYITRGEMCAITNNMIYPRNSIDTVRVDLCRQKNLFVDLLNESEELFYASSLHALDINFLKKAEVKR